MSVIAPPRAARPSIVRRLVIAASPHIRGPVSTPVIMWNVVGSLLPIVAAATWFFGPSALLVVAGRLQRILAQRVLARTHLDSSTRELVASIIRYIVLVAGAIAYEIYFTGSPSGQTLGKKALGIRVEPRDAAG